MGAPVCIIKKNFLLSSNSLILWLLHLFCTNMYWSDPLHCYYGGKTMLRTHVLWSPRQNTNSLFYVQVSLISILGLGDFITVCSAKLLPGEQHILVLGSLNQSIALLHTYLARDFSFTLMRNINMILGRIFFLFFFLG